MAPPMAKPTINACASRPALERMDLFVRRPAFDRIKERAAVLLAVDPAMFVASNV